MATDFTEESAADAVIESFADTPGERLAAVLSSLVRHLHGFVRDVQPTIAEWEHPHDRAQLLPDPDGWAGRRVAACHPAAPVPARAHPTSS